MSRYWLSWYHYTNDDVANRTAAPLRRSLRIMARKSFRLFDLPIELRWNIYSHMLPSGGRIILDPEMLYHPLPYSAQPCENAIKMMLLNRRAYAEVSEFFYVSNTITIIFPRMTSISRASGLSSPPGTWIRTLRLHSTAMQCGPGQTPQEIQIIKQCPNLQTLFIVLYHDMGWETVFGVLAEHAFAGNLELRLDIELYTSVVAKREQMSGRDRAVKRLGDALDQAKHSSPKFRINWCMLPATVKHVVMTVSVTSDTTSALLKWRGRGDMSRYFKQLSYQKGPPEMTRVTWAKRTVSK